MARDVVLEEEREDDLLGWVEWWNFMDWVPGWPAGEVPGERMLGGSAANTFLLAYAARMAAEIESWAGEPVLAQRNRELADRLTEGCKCQLWDDEAGCFADTVERKSWSEHAQLLALLAGVDPQCEERLLQDEGIVRNRLKIESTISNARAYLEVQAAEGSFADYIWRFVDDVPLDAGRERLRDVPASTPVSEAMSKDLKRRGFRFVGGTICYAFMQAAGLVNDHTTDCFRHKAVKRLAGPRRA